MNLKQSLLILGCVGFLSTLPIAHADGWRETHFVQARVVNVEPIIRWVQVPGFTRRICWATDRQRRIVSPANNPNYVGNTIIGAVIGGVIGHQFGHGGHYTGPTVAGALLGGAIAHDFSQGERQAYTINEPIQRCEVRRSMRAVQEVVAYRVWYRFHGRLFKTRMAHEPGRFIDLKIHERAMPEE